MVWLEFLVCASLLTYFAYNLCKEGIILSEKTTITHGIIGIFFLAIATSFPEIVTAGSAVFFLGRIGLGYGDIIGSLIVNTMILAGLDYFSGKGRILLKVSGLNRLTGIYVLLLLLIVLGAAVLRFSGMLVPSFQWIGIESLLIVVIYFVAIQILRKRDSHESPQLYKDEVKRESPWTVWGKFIVLLIVVMGLGVWMAKTGENIVVRTGLSETFTGALLLGFATSLPEIIVSFAALRAGSVDMAVGNILGSNMFDVLIIPFLDVLTRKPILGLLTLGQIIATGVVVLLSAIVVLSCFVKKDTSRRINWDTGLIFAIGLLGFVIIYYVR